MTVEVILIPGGSASIEVNPEDVINTKVVEAGFNTENYILRADNVAVDKSLTFAAANLDDGSTLVFSQMIKGNEEAEA